MIGIVLLNYNTWDLTIKCVDSIRDTYREQYKIYIVDNSSTINMTNEFRKHILSDSNCRLIISKNNKGYAGGNNIGLKAALEDHCDYILISNNDVIYQNDSIEELCHYLKTHKEYGIAGPKIFLPSGELQEINMGCKMTMSGKYKYLLRKTPIRRISRKFVNDFHASYITKTEPFNVYAVSGCCFMMTRSAASMLYPFDESTFLYEEENIIGTRMELLGLKTVYDTKSTIIHLGGASTGGMSEFAYRCFVESEIYYCRRYLKAAIISVLPLYLFRTFIYIKSYSKKHMGEYFSKTIYALIKKKTKNRYSCCSFDYKGD